MFVASDHAGFSFKKKLMGHLKSSLSFQNIRDLGTYGEESCDYPDWADLVCQSLQESGQWGILICASGLGMSMRANRYSHIRGALCWDENTAYLSRKHNDANVLCLSSRLLGEEVLFKISEVFFQTGFEGGRHEGRLCKLSQPVGCKLP